MNRCRNCGATAMQDLGFTGMLAPFFLKRVFGMKVGFASSASPFKQMLQKVAAVPRSWLNRISRPAVFVELQLCTECSFVQAKIPFEEQAINRLYLDYRSDSYNRERIEYEPSYAAIAANVGQDPIEIEGRVTAATNFIKDKIPTIPDFTILDYGGADGKFLPRLEGKKFVFEISNIPPIPGVERVASEAEMDTYSLVQLTHVIEHVVQPLDLVTHVGAKVKPGGFLYLETPQELTDQQRTELTSGTRLLPLHEHINSYCIQAVSRLMEQAGFNLVSIEAQPVNVGWATATHIRALGQKPNQA